MVHVEFSCMGFNFCWQENCPVADTTLECISKLLNVANCSNIRRTNEVDPVGPSYKAHSISFDDCSFVVMVVHGNILFTGHCN